MKESDFNFKIKFGQIFQNNSLEWGRFFNLPRFLNIDNHTKVLQFRILHRIIPTNHSLFKMNIKPSNKCDYCFIHVDTLEHAFWKCFTVKNF